jgi:hypothetical protein
MTDAILMLVPVAALVAVLIAAALTTKPPRPL